jgi:hypothetical protein
MDLTPNMIVVLMLIFIVAYVVLKLIFRVAYKMKPYREMVAIKPSIVLLPKYKAEVTLADELVDSVALEKRLASFGFKKSSEEDGRTYFVRGHILGGFSFSIKHVRLKLGFKSLQNGKSEITLESGVPIAFDTGDCWTFLTELSEKLGKDIV